MYLDRNILILLLPLFLWIFGFLDFVFCFLVISFLCFLIFSWNLILGGILFRSKYLIVFLVFVSCFFFLFNFFFIFLLI